MAVLKSTFRNLSSQLSCSYVKNINLPHSLLSLKTFSKKERIYVYIKLIHVAIYLKLTQHCKSTYNSNKIFLK